jgi:hypothetical protein
MAFTQRLDAPDGLAPEARVFLLTLLPLLTWRRDENLPGGHPVRPLQVAEGEPGVKAGQ